jgi:uncharacterized protein (DUF1778 family)
MQTEARNAPINIRARQTQRELIDRAAAAQHKSRSDFILEAACKEAENVLLDQRLFLRTYAVEMRSSTITASCLFAA